MSKSKQPSDGTFIVLIFHIILASVNVFLGLQSQTKIDSVGNAVDRIDRSTVISHDVYSEQSVAAERLPTQCTVPAQRASFEVRITLAIFVGVGALLVIIGCSVQSCCKRFSEPFGLPGVPKMLQLSNAGSSVFVPRRWLVAWLVWIATAWKSARHKSS